MQGIKLRYIILLLGVTFTSCAFFQSKQNATTNKAISTNVAVLPVAPDTTKKVEVKKAPIWLAKKHQYNPSRTIFTDLVHTKLDVKFDFAKRYLLGTATITFKPHFYPNKSVILDAKGMDIQSVNLLKNNQLSPLLFTYDKLKINITLDKEYLNEEKYTLVIKYTAKPDELPKGGSAAITSDKGLYFINPDGTDKNKPTQIWTQGETEAASCWFPTIDSPNMKCTQEISITVDKKYSTLSNGTLEHTIHNADGTITDYWKQDKPHSPYLFMMAIGEFAVVKDTWKGLEVNYLVEPAYKKYAKAIFGNTPEMLEFFSNKLEYPYPWDKYSQVVVRDYVSGAMENTSATIMMDALQVNNRELLDKNWDGIIAHELFHHWFGDLATCESWANLPLNESFANYSEYLWEEYKYGKDAADYHNLDETEQYFREAQHKQEPLIRYFHSDREDMFDSHSYAKGGRVLHMLRNYVGDQAFFKSLSLYLKTNAYKATEIHDLRKAFEEVTGEDLNWFFNQYFLSPGHADLLVKHEYDNGKLTLEVKQLQDSAYTPIYKIPVKVDIWENGEKKREQIWITKAQQTFTFEVASRPNLVLFDGEQQLLAEIVHEKSAAELAFQYVNSDKFLARLQALILLSSNDKKEDKPLIENTFKLALNDKFWALRDEALEYYTENKNADSAAVLAEMLKIAEIDNKPEVKAKAIRVLAEDNWRTNLSSNLVQKALNDSAYSVVAAGIFATQQLNSNNKNEIFAKYEKESNLQIIETLAAIYAETKDSTKYDWFVSRINQAEGVEKYYTLNHFSNFVEAMPFSIQQKAFDKMKIIVNDTAELWYAKWGAFKTISKLNKIENFKPYLEEVAAKATEPELQKRYKRLLDSLKK